MSGNVVNGGTDAHDVATANSFTGKRVVVKTVKERDRGLAYGR